MSIIERELWLLKARKVAIEKTLILGLMAFPWLIGEAAAPPSATEQPTQSAIL